MSDNVERLDELLDQGLKSYVGQAAPLGIERRVLHRVHAGTPGWWIWLPAAVTVAALCLALLIVTSRPAGPVPRAAKRPQSPAIIVAVASPAPAVLRPRRRQAHVELVKPEPLSAAERTLLSFLANEPKDGRGEVHRLLLAMDRSRPIEELRIEPLQDLTPEVQPEVQNKEIQP